MPGHWEGDLIIGRNNRSAIGTLVERSTRFVILLHLPGRYGAVEVREAMATAILQLPEHLRRSITWDQGSEMTRHREFSIDTGVDVYFCDPHAPWQRGSNENTNGLLRQYFPKFTDLSVHSAADVCWLASYAFFYVGVVKLARQRTAAQGSTRRRTTASGTSCSCEQPLGRMAKALGG